MNNNRDNFSKATKELLAKRVGYRCSNPHCGKLTIGAAQKEDEVINVGVAAHIKAAAPGGPRYDPYMTEEERKSPKNGIWLCQTCSKLIDSDVGKYTVHLLQDWKDTSEAMAVEAVERQSPATARKEDVQLIKFYVQCMDRPAIQDPVRIQARRHDSKLEDFEQAIKDTIVALNTGVLRTRDGDILKVAEGRSQLRNAQWNQKMGQVVWLLTEIRHEIKWCRSSGGHIFSLEQLIEKNRREAISVINTICEEAGIVGLCAWSI